MANERCSIQLVNEDRKFNGTGLEKFIEQVKLKECGLSYKVVSIIGPRSSGKSTLLNHLFGTSFKEMDAYKGRSQTTTGIWLARGASIEPCLLVMDIKGTDGSERGEDVTTFEKQSSLFAVAVSDIVLINMCCHDIGREQAANKPLLKLVFQMMMRNFNPRQNTLMFVIQDQSKTPLEKLRSNLSKDVQKIWNSVAEQEGHEGSPLSKFFNVEVVALTNYEKEEQQFTEQVANLRQKYFHSIALGGLIGNREAMVPASGFSISLCSMWEKIENNKDLYLPTHQVMVAIVRCDEIVKNFDKTEEWLQLEEKVKSKPVPSLGMELHEIVATFLLRYDEEAMYFDAHVSSAKKAQLRDKLLQLVRPAVRSILEHLRSGTFDEFKEAFDKALNGGEAFSSTAQSLGKSFMDKFEKGCADAAIDQADSVASEARNKLQHDIHLYIASVRNAKLSDLTAEYKDKLTKELSGGVYGYLDEASDETWPKIRKLFMLVTESVDSEFSNALLNLNLDEKSKKNMRTKLQHHARGLVESEAKKQARRVLEHMIERFESSFAKSVCIYATDEHIEVVARTTRLASLKLLSVMVAFRLDNKPDKIEDKLRFALLDPQTSGTGVGPLASSTWEEIPSSETLITPVECKELWSHFTEKTAPMVKRAHDEHAAYLARAAYRAPAAYRAQGQGANGHIGHRIQHGLHVLHFAHNICRLFGW